MYRSALVFVRFKTSSIPEGRIFEDINSREELLSVFFPMDWKLSDLVRTEWKLVSTNFTYFLLTCIKYQCSWFSQIHVVTCAHHTWLKRVTCVDILSRIWWLQTKKPLNLPALFFSQKTVSRSCADKQLSDVWCKLDVKFQREFYSKLDVNLPPRKLSTWVILQTVCKPSTWVKLHESMWRTSTHMCEWLATWMTTHVFALIAHGDSGSLSVLSTLMSSAFIFCGTLVTLKASNGFAHHRVSVVNHRSAESKDLRFDCSELFTLSHVRDRTKVFFFNIRSTKYRTITMREAGVTKTKTLEN